MQVTYEVVVPTTQEVAFAFVSNPDNWTRFIKGLQSARGDDDWGRVGGHGHAVLRFLGRDVRSELEITKWDPPHGFSYIMAPEGRPPVDNRRTFEAVTAGTHFVGTSTGTPRSGLAGLFDRVQLRMVKRVMDTSLHRLATLLPNEDVEPS